MLAMTTTTNSPRYVPRQAQFTCKWCHKQFVREQYYLAHKCSRMKRDEEIKSPLGQAALAYYQHWFRVQRRQVPRPEAFLTSTKYRTMLNFAEYVKRIGIQQPEKFIWLMVERDMDPIFWTTKEAYGMYLSFIDNDQPPMEQVLATVDALSAYADKHEIDISDVFEVMTPAEALSMIEARKLSPWLLILSRKFHSMYISRGTTEQQELIESLIRPELWEQKFKKQPNLVKSIKRLVKEMQI